METILQNYKQNFAIILLAIYSLGYAYLYQYYNRFNIEIEYYINLTDIIFFTLKYFFYIILLYGIIEIITRIVSHLLIHTIFRLYHFKTISRIKKKNIDEAEIEIKKFYDENLKPHYKEIFQMLPSWIFVFSACAVLFYTNELLLILSFVIPYLFLKWTFSEYLKTKGKQNLELYMATVIFFLFAFTVFGYTDAEEVKKKTPRNLVEFSLNNQIFKSVDTPILIIGETSMYYFIYDKKKEETIILNKDHLDYFKIVDPNVDERKQDQILKQKSKQNTKELEAFFKKIKLPKKQ